MNAVSGILKTEARLDRDTGTVCQFLSIQARDSAGDNSLANVTEVSVADNYDNHSPSLSPSLSLSLSLSFSLSLSLSLSLSKIEVCLIDENDNCPNFTQPSFSGRVCTAAM